MQGLIRNITSLLTAFLCASALAQEPQAPATAPSTDPYAHLPRLEGGPGWTLQDLRAAIPPGTQPMQVETNLAVGKIDNIASAMLAAMDRLRSTSRADQELALRISGAVIKQTAFPDAIRLLSYLTYHGIGTRSDPGAAVRTTLPLIRSGDYLACEFAAKESPTTFKNAANKVSGEKLKTMKGRTPIHIAGKIVGMSGESVTLEEIGNDVRLIGPVAKMSPGRQLDVWGLVVDERIIALLAEVPEPSASFKWNVNASPVRGGTWQVHSVRVTVSNDGVQPIKSVKFSVRCYINNGAVNDQTQTAEVQDIAPGKSKAIDVGFEMYNYQYIDTVSTPKAQVQVKEVEW